MTKLTEEAIAEIWNRHMDGWSDAEIARYSWDLFRGSRDEGRELSSRDVRGILSLDPPAAILTDLRYIHGVRAFFIAATGRVQETDLALNGLVAAFQPYRLNGKLFEKALRAIRRDFASLCPDGKIVLNVVEGVEMDVMLRLLHAGKTIGWIIDGEGEIKRYDGEFSLDKADITDPIADQMNP